MDEISRPNAIDTFHLTVSQVHDWIVYRDPEQFQTPDALAIAKFAIFDSDIKHLQDAFPGKSGCIGGGLRLTLVSKKIDSVAPQSSRFKDSRLATGARLRTASAGLGTSP